jgi:hypothetical protein
MKRLFDFMAWILLAIVFAVGLSLIFGSWPDEALLNDCGGIRSSGDVSEDDWTQTQPLPQQDPKPNLGHLEPLEINIRDLIAEAGEHHSRKVIVGPLVFRWNDLERQSFRGYEITGVFGKMFTINYHVDIEVFYNKLPDVAEWRHYDGSTKEAFIIEGTFSLYRDSNTQGFIRAEKITKISVGEYNQ